MEDIVDFRTLAEKDYNFDWLFAMKQFWKGNEQWKMSHPRPTSALLYFEKGEGICQLTDGRKLVFREGMLVSIPQGNTYTWTFCNSDMEYIQTFLCEFTLFDSEKNRVIPSGGIRMLGEIPGAFSKAMFEKLILEYTRPKRCPGAVKACAYELLSCVCRMSDASDISMKDYRMILPGIRYLEEDGEQKLSIQEIAALCHVSVSYFERLFKKYCGKTPTEYRLEKKIEKVKELLLTEMFTVEEIAVRLDFCDPAYLSRVFRKKTGFTISEYKRFRTGAAIQ